MTISIDPHREIQHFDGYCHKMRKVSAVKLGGMIRYDQFVGPDLGKFSSSLEASATSVLLRILTTILNGPIRAEYLKFQPIKMIVVKMRSNKLPGLRKVSKHASIGLKFGT